MCSFTLAIDRHGKEESRTNFIPVKVLGKTAENVANFLSKGRLAGVEGEIQTDSYEAKDGSKRYTWEVLAYRVEFLEWGEKKEATPQGQRFEAEQFEQAEQARQNINNVLGINATFESIGADDIPF
jgi:single-strand DNA-binding protein